MRAGFTLLELVVVVLIVSVVAAATAPALLGTARDRDDGRGATAVEQLVDRARRTAVQGGEPVTVVIEPDGARFWVRVGEAAGPDELVEGVLPLASGERIVAATERVSLTFEPGGAVWGGPVVVQGDAGTTRIGADPWTGARHVRR